jgi:alpha-beta hydrolase superfamily lysophospholipase
LQEYPGVNARGAIFSAPLVGVAMEVPRWKERLAGILTYILPALPLSSGLDPAHLSHDPLIVEAYRRDPLVHDRVTPRLYTEIRSAIDVAFQRAARLRVPSLFLIPSADKLVRPDLMQRFAAEVGASGRVEVRTLAGLYHEVLNESTRSSVVADLLGWIERRLQVYSPSPELSEPTR